MEDDGSANYAWSASSNFVVGIGINKAILIVCLLHDEQEQTMGICVFHINEILGVTGDWMSIITKAQQGEVACILVQDGGTKLLQVVTNQSIAPDACCHCEEGKIGQDALEWHTYQFILKARPVQLTFKTLEGWNSCSTIQMIF
eukprot:6079652-Ditylum_brightwellii.AAC.1